MTILFLALWLQMSAHQSWIVPNGECGQHADGSYTDCCGAMGDLMGGLLGGIGR